MLDQLVRLSREMLSLAGQGEWERVAGLQIERQQMMGQTFPLDSSLTDTQGAAGQVKEILDLDQQITELARVQQKEIGQLLGKLNQGRTATRAYRDTSRHQT